MKKSVVIPQMKKTKRVTHCLFDERGTIDACLLVIDGSIRVCCNNFVTQHTHSLTYTYTHRHITHTHPHPAHTHTHIDGDLDTGPGQLLNTIDTPGDTRSGM